MWIGFAWLACTADPTVDPDPCRPGFSLGPDGHCYPPPPRYPDPTVADALANLPDCAERPAGDEVDLATGCVDGQCIGNRFDAFVAAFGLVACNAVDPLGQQYECDFGEGRAAGFIGPANRDTPPNDADAAYLRLREGFEGATPTGLGVGVGARCFVEQLGSPDEVSFEQIAGEWLVSELQFDEVGPEVSLIVRDRSGEGLDGPDGAVDDLFLLP